MASDLTEPALGRPFTLGMLYDARNARLMPGITLWDSETLQRNTNTEVRRLISSKITSSDTLDDKSTMLNVEASMKASFMSGMVEVGGSAKFMNDMRKFKNQNRVSFHFKATTTSKYLTINTLTTQNKPIVDDSLRYSATHVVTQIVYGANAFFVFDTEKLESSKVQDIEGKLEIALNKIKSFSAGAEASVKLSDEEKNLTSSLSCKYFGDFILESNPTTVKEALQTYQQLPKLLEGGKCCVPIEVTLTPLNMVDGSAAELKNISTGLVRKVEDVIEDVKKIEMRCNDCLEEPSIESFTQVKNKLSTFKRLCNDYIGKLQQIMREKFPSIRDGKEDESSVERLFDDRNGSPFSHDKLDKWMEDKEREINIIKSCVDKMKNATIVCNKSDLDAKLLGPDVEHALCFTFTSLGGHDPYLDELEYDLHSHDSHSNQNITHAMQDQWYTSDVMFKITKEAEIFQSHAKGPRSSRVCFLVAAIENEKYKGASIYHYKRGVLITDDFSQPDLSQVETIENKTHLILYACDLTLDPNTVNGYLGLSEENKKVTIQSWQHYPEHPERFGPQIYQVLCKEGLTGRCYWEVEWSQNKDEGLAVAYKQNGFQAINFGSQLTSWYLYQCGNNLYAKHNDTDEICGSIDPAGCRRIGVYLDWSAGTLSFYRVSTTTNTLTHLHTFRTSFTEPVYPGFYLYTASTYASLPPVV